ncbi:MAG: GTPase ObgE [Christensenellales bacterium]|nr:GTPase ObgE [Christensenellales bacterium]
MFVDIVNITVKAGDGGNGCVSFHREKFVQAGGPDGGDGGRGGSVVFAASERMHTLMDFRINRKFSAGNGEDGSSNRRTGKNGADVVIEVPPGTVVRERSSGKLLLDLYEQGMRKVLVKGGKGGFGNQHFATPTRQAPQFAKPGEKREVIELTLELKSIADVGLVGFPNVGKSTILSVVTSARPKIANYHFTTLQPNLGIVKQGEESFVMADIPGLVEGASEGVGLGHAFLRHVERTRMLLHVLDIAGSEGRDPLEDYDTIMKELEAYGDLKNRPMIVVANKTDLPGAEENLARLRARLEGTGIAVFPASAATNPNFKALLYATLDLLKTCPPAEPFAEEPLWELYDAEEEPFTVTREGGYYVVTGKAMDRLIDSVNFDNEDSLNYFHRMLRRWGVIDALREQGAKEGDQVVIGEMEFDFVD